MPEGEGLNTNGIGTSCKRISVKLLRLRGRRKTRPVLPLAEPLILASTTSVDRCVSPIPLGYLLSILFRLPLPAMAGPGSVLNRALRSRLVRQQLARADARHFGLQSRLNVQRSYSSNVHLKDELPISPMQKISFGPKPAPPQLINTKDTLDPARSHKESEWEKENQQLLRLSSTWSLSPVLHGKIRKEMAWLQDPREIERRVTTLLSAKALTTSLALLREAQRQRRNCVVGWNRLFQYCMDRGHLMPAFKFFNDVSHSLMSASTVPKILGPRLSRMH